MDVRALDDQPSNVIPSRSKTIGPAVEAVTPEPAQLYRLIVLAFLLHTPEPGSWCASCGEVWPCRQVRLAFRLREGF